MSKNFSTKIVMPLFFFHGNNMDLIALKCKVNCTDEKIVNSRILKKIKTQSSYKSIVAGNIVRYWPFKDQE
jgi:hypothetical protein